MYIYIYLYKYVEILGIKFLFIILHILNIEIYL